MLWGAIAGDVIGSAYEWRPVKTTDFDLFSPRSRFTDDTVMTVAVAQALIAADGDPNLGPTAMTSALQQWGRQYPLAGYGAHFGAWLESDQPQPYGSWGNGAAMRVSAVGWWCQSLAEVEQWAQISASVTHNHPEGIKGAQATASAVFMARQGASQADITDYITKRFNYDLTQSLAEIRPEYRFDVSCQGSVPQAIIAFAEAHDLESAIRNAVSLGGDADTQAAIAGAIAEAAWGIPASLAAQVQTHLDPSLCQAITAFEQAVKAATNLWPS